MPQPDMLAVRQPPMAGIGDERLGREALVHAHALLAAEMVRRGMYHRSPLGKAAEAAAEEEEEGDMIPPEEMAKAMEQITKRYPNEHSCRLAEPGTFERFRRENGKMVHDGKPIDVIFGVKADGEAEIQAMRYPADRWEPAAAHTHCESHQGRFEAATGQQKAAEEVAKVVEPVSKPYASVADLPPAVRALPSHAQTIVRAAFNAAFAEYNGDEERAFRVAWAAVKQKYEQRGGEWVAKAWVELGKSRLQWVQLRTTLERVDRYVPIAKVDVEKRIVYGIVLQPGDPRHPDTQNDYITADEIEAAAHGFMVHWRAQKAAIGRQHAKKIAADVVELFIAPQNMTIGEQAVKKGSWVAGIKINDAATWAAVKAGELTGFSIGGWGERMAP